MKSAKIMFAYAAVLIACGLTAYFMAPPGAKAATALIISSATAAIMIICAVMAQRINSNRTVGMIGIHAGLILPLLFAIVFGMRAYKTFDTGGDAKRYLAVILTGMAVASVIAFFAILTTRPAKLQRIASAP